RAGGLQRRNLLRERGWRIPRRDAPAFVLQCQATLTESFAFRDARSGRRQEDHPVVPDVRGEEGAAGEGKGKRVDEPVAGGGRDSHAQRGCAEDEIPRGVNRDDAVVAGVGPPDGAVGSHGDSPWGLEREL